MQTFPSVRTNVDELRRYHLEENRNSKQDGGALHRWWRAAVHRWERRKMIAALEAMDDQLLRDIGIYRNDIPRVVDGLNDREFSMRPLAAPPQNRSKSTMTSITKQHERRL